MSSVYSNNHPLPFVGVVQQKGPRCRTVCRGRGPETYVPWVDCHHVNTLTAQLSLATPSLCMGLGVVKKIDYAKRAMR